MTWKEVALPTAVLHVAEGHEAEGDRFRAYFTSAHAALAKEFGEYDADALMKDPVVCDIYLVPVATRVAGPGRALSTTSYGDRSYCEIHLMPSSAMKEEERCCTNVGERRDEVNDEKTAVHEYGGILLDRISRRYAG